MEQSKKVSVILPNYNGAKYLKRAIESVLNQTYKNFELIIIDDCSNDNSRDIILSFSDERIKTCFETVNRHVAYTVNLGFEKANGDYIARIDSDDIWDKQKLEKQILFMEANLEYGACFTRIHLIDEESNLADEKYWLLYSLYNGESNREQKEWAKFFFYKGNCLCNPSVLIRKEALQTIGCGYNIAYVPAQDFEMWTRMVIKYPIYILDEQLTYYRWTDEESKISGFDEGSSHAFTNVHMLVRYHYFDKMTDDEFIALFWDEFRRKDGHSYLELECEKAYLLENCVCDAENAGFLGLLKFEEILSDKEGIKTLEKKFDFSLKNFYKKYRKHIFFCDVDEITLKKKDEMIEKQININFTLQNELEIKSQQLNKSREEMANLLNSTSWKVTSPFRKLKKIINDII